MVLVVIKALDVLEYLGQDQERAFTLTEISESLDFNQATCANILKTLVSRNYVEHMGRKKGYKLGHMAFNLPYNQDLILAAKEVMEDLTAKLNETSLLGVLRNQKRFILHLVNSDQDLQVRSRSERNVYETASGRILLAYLSKNERDNFIASNGLPAELVWKEATTPEAMHEALDKIAQDELVITYSMKHIIGVAVPIHKDEKVIAALSVFLPEIRFSAAKKKEIVQAMKAAAKLIMETLVREHS